MSETKAPESAFAKSETMTAGWRAIYRDGTRVLTRPGFACNQQTEKQAETNRK